MMPKKRSKPTPTLQKSSAGVHDRARELLLRLETDGHDPIRAAEEIERLQPALERGECWEDVAERLEELCDAWSELPLRGDRGSAWLVLVGVLDAKRHAEQVSRLAEDAAQAAPLRLAAMRVLPRLGGEEAGDTLVRVLQSRSDPAIRAAAAEALGLLGDVSLAPMIEAWMDDETSPAVWKACASALERLAG